ncbi:MAG: hypothetical protein MRY79_01060 [Alphaproteobacteria bacterium]|nr:hypothetical protein [Alphaproteobacteria bacterium]
MSEKKIQNTPETRRNIYAVTLLGSVIALAIVGLLSLWGAGLEETFTIKAVFSFITIAGVSAFLYTLTHNHDIKLIKRLGNLTGILAVIFGGCILGQIWLDMFDEVFFAKFIGSIVILALLIAFAIAVFDDFFENKKLKDENYLD